MNKKEKSIIMKRYEEILEVSTMFDKKDSIFEFKCLMMALDLENEMKIVENNHFLKNNNLSFLQKEGYSTLCDIIMKYNGAKVVEFENIIEYYNEYWLEMSAEHQKCADICLNMIEGI